MKIKILIALSFIAVSCKKQIPIKQINASVNGNSINPQYAQFNKISENNIFSFGSDPGNTLKVNLGPEIKESYLFSQSSFFGYNEKVDFYYGGFYYYVLDSIGQFTFNVQINEELKNGSFSGSLYNNSQGALNLSGSFFNL